MTKKNGKPKGFWAERLAIIETDIAWLKKGYWIQTLLSIGTFITVLGLVLNTIRMS
jgi:hypothetical protein